MTHHPIHPPALSYFLAFHVDGRDNAEDPVTIRTDNVNALIELRGSSVTSGCDDLTMLTADEARNIARALLIAADQLEVAV